MTCGHPGPGALCTVLGTPYALAMGNYWQQWAAGKRMQSCVCVAVPWTPCVLHRAAEHTAVLGAPYAVTTYCTVLLNTLLTTQCHWPQRPVHRALCIDHEQRVQYQRVTYC